MLRIENERIAKTVSKVEEPAEEESPERISAIEDRNGFSLQRATEFAQDRKK